MGSIKKVLLWVVCLSMLGCFFTMNGSNRSLTSTALVKSMSEVSIALVTDEFDTKKSWAPYCTGVWLDDRHILTARHCLMYATPEMKILFEEGLEIDVIGNEYLFAAHSDWPENHPYSLKARHATVEFVDHNRDLAILTASLKDVPKDHTSVMLANAPVLQGEPVHIMGHNHGYWWSYMRGYVAAVRPTAYGPWEHAMKVLQVEAPVWKGTSGGGAFNDDEELIGIASWIVLDVPNTAFFIHIDEIKAFIRRSLPVNHKHRK